MADAARRGWAQNGPAHGQLSFGQHKAVLVSAVRPEPLASRKPGTSRSASPSFADRPPRKGARQGPISRCPPASGGLPVIRKLAATNEATATNEGKSAMKVLAVVLAGGAITVVVKPQIPIPAIVAFAMGLAAVLAIVVWNLRCGGSASLNRSPKGYLSFRVNGPRARRRAARPKTAASSAERPSGDTPVNGTPDSCTPRSTASGPSTTFAGVCVAVVLLFGGLYTWAMPGHPPAVKQPPTAVQPSPSAPSSKPDPAAVIRDYYAAINSRDWKRIGELWPGKPGHHPSYAQIAAGFRQTKRDVVMKLRTSGDHVSARVVARETTGAVQTYVVHYVVRHGRITHGWGRLLPAHHS
jgi:hypothetical protein